jgi:competence protein ComEA
MFISISNPTDRRIRRRAGSRARMQLMQGLLLSLLLLAGEVGADDAALLDLNRATVVQLEALPGIGSSKAAAIVAAREQSGGFRSVDELEGVRGIGPALLEKLRPLVKVGSTAGSATGSASRAPAAARR